MWAQKFTMIAVTLVKIAGAWKDLLEILEEGIPELSQGAN